MLKFPLINFDFKQITFLTLAFVVGLNDAVLLQDGNTNDINSLASSQYQQPSYILTNLLNEADDMYTQDAILQAIEQFRKDASNAIIDNNKPKPNSTTVCCPTFKSQITNLSAITPSAQNKEINTNLQTQLDKQNAQMINQQMEQVKRNDANANLQLQIDNLSDTNANLTSFIANSLPMFGDVQNHTINSITSQYPDTRQLFQVTRTPTPPVPETQMLGTPITYNNSTVNVGNCVNVETGVFTAPLTGLYYFTWTGPYNEYIQKSTASIFVNSVSNRMPDTVWVSPFAVFNESTSFDVGSLKSQAALTLNKGDTMGLISMFKMSLFPKQYEKWVGYFLG